MQLMRLWIPTETFQKGDQNDQNVELSQLAIEIISFHNYSIWTYLEPQKKWSSTDKEWTTRAYKINEQAEKVCHRVSTYANQYSYLLTKYFFLVYSGNRNRYRSFK